MSDADEHPLLGALLSGRYRLDQLRGAGAMGQVFAASDLQMNRPVAVKLMDVDSDDPTWVERLYREACSAARANHPAVVTPYEYGRDDDVGVVYITMELLEGEDLGQRQQRVGPMPVGFLRHVAGELADVLVAVHEAGVIHRDVKPANIFLGRRGRRVDEVRLLDFGVAKQRDLQTLTRTGQIFGTPLYMAPEQLRDSRSVDARSDLYALGAVLFECATARLPYPAINETMLIAQHLFAPEPDVSVLRPDLSASFCSVITGCLKRDPALRPQSAREVCDALQSVGC